MQNPYSNPPRPQNVLPHANIAQFGSPNFQNQFYGQVFPTNPNGGFGMNQGQYPQSGHFQSNPAPSSQQGQSNSSNPNNNPFSGRQ
jgi:hypothetical protein